MDNRVSLDRSLLEVEDSIARQSLVEIVIATGHGYMAYISDTSASRPVSELIEDDMTGMSQQRLKQLRRPARSTYRMITSLPSPFAQLTSIPKFKTGFIQQGK